MKAFGIVQVVGTIVTIFLAIIVWGLPFAPGIMLLEETIARSASEGTVSYTHLTLPTILRV